MLISSGIPPPPAHMSESFIKRGSGPFLARSWAFSRDNINEPRFQTAVYDAYQLLGLNNRMNASCRNKDLIWRTYSEQDAEVRDACGHELLGQFKPSISDQCKLRRFPASDAGHWWRFWSLWTCWWSDRVCASRLLCGVEMNQLI